MHHCRRTSEQSNGLHSDSGYIYNKNRNDQYDEETVSMTVIARFGTGGQHSDCSYWMTDKAGHLCRFTKIDKCNTLQATDYKDPPVIVTRK